jgi:hypothetical protein
MQLARGPARGRRPSLAEQQSIPKRSPNFPASTFPTSMPCPAPAPFFPSFSSLLPSLPPPLRSQSEPCSNLPRPCPSPTPKPTHLPRHPVHLYLPSPFPLLSCLLTGLPTHPCPLPFFPLLPLAARLSHHHRGHALHLLSESGPPGVPASKDSDPDNGIAPDLHHRGLVYAPSLPNQALHAPWPRGPSASLGVSVDLPHAVCSGLGREMATHGLSSGAGGRQPSGGSSYCRILPCLRPRQAEPLVARVVLVLEGHGPSLR